MLNTTKRSRCSTLFAMCAAAIMTTGLVLDVNPAVAQSSTKMADMKAEVGKKAPNFTLTDLDGTEHSLSDFKGKIVVLEWYNPDCPFVVHQHKEGPLKDQGNKVNAKEDMVWVAINSGAPGKQGTGIEYNQRKAKGYSMNYPILLDESGDVGRMYGAKTTPHMYVIDAEGVLRYDGAIDNAAMGKVRGGGEFVNYVEQAINAIEAGSEVEVTQMRPYGCSVKYGAASGEGRGERGRGRGRGG